MHTDVKILGAGGHAAVVVGAARLMGYSNISVFDQNPRLAGQHIANTVVQHLGQVSSAEFEGLRWHIAIGDNSARHGLYSKLIESNGDPVTIIHPASIVDSTCTVGKGSFLAAGSVIAANATVGIGVIVNHNVVVDHDCRVGDWTHIAPGAILGGGSEVSDSCLIGAGAVVLPGVCIGQGAVVGAGAVVTRDVGQENLVVGIPAKRKGK